MSAKAGLLSEQLVFRRTNALKGRTVSVTPANSPMEHLAYGRIILDAGTAEVAFDTGDRETGLVCLTGSASVTVDGQAYALGRYDALYIPRDEKVEVSTASIPPPERGPPGPPRTASPMTMRRASSKTPPVTSG
mgnify:CR=1 FL=1